MGDDAEKEFGLFTVSIEVEAADFDLAGGFAFGASKNGDEAGFASAVWAEEGEEFALFDGEVKVGESGSAAGVCFVEVFNL